MPRIYRTTGPTANKADGPGETKNKTPAQEAKNTAKNTGKKDNGGDDK